MFYRSERGAVLMHVAVSLLVLIGLTTWVIDYGLMWVGRVQIQTSADAAALAAAIHINNDDPDDFDGAKAQAIVVGQRNGVWAGAPDIQIGDVNFIPCPPGTGVPDTCVKVDAYRNQERNNPLPIFFGSLVGVVSQGVKATATAQVAPANGTTCLKPWMVPDKFDDVNGNNFFDLGTDTYATPGYTAEDDYGTRITLKAGDPHDAASPGFFYPISEPDTSASAAEYRAQIAGCLMEGWIGKVMESNPGNMVGPTRLGMEDLIALDDEAMYDEESGTVINSPYGLSSPRIVPVALYSPVEWAGLDRSSGRFPITIVNILMFFVESASAGEVTGVIIKSPGEIFPSVPGFPSAGGGFLNIVRLVR